MFVSTVGAWLQVWDPKAIPTEDYWPALQQQLAARKRARVSTQPVGPV